MTEHEVLVMLCRFAAAMMWWRLWVEIRLTEYQ